LGCSVVCHPGRTGSHLQCTDPCELIWRKLTVSRGLHDFLEADSQLDGAHCSDIASLLASGVGSRSIDDDRDSNRACHRRDLAKVACRRRKGIGFGRAFFGIAGHELHVVIGIYKLPDGQLLVSDYPGCLVARTFPALGVARCSSLVTALSWV